MKALTTPVQDAWKMPTKSAPQSRDGRVETQYVLRLEGDRIKRRVYRGEDGTHSVNIRDVHHALAPEELAKVERLAARGLW